MNEGLQSRRRRGWIVGVVLMVLGVIAVVPGAVKSVLAFVDAFDGPKISVPGQRQVHLSEGDYDLYERTSEDASPTLRPTAISVTAADGSTVPIRGTDRSSTIEHGDTSYERAVGFTIPDSGDYEIRVTALEPGEVMVVRSLGSTFRDAVPWIGLASAGGIAFVAGAIVVLVSVLRRSSGSIPATVAGWPAAWYADPYDPGSLRYWDGRAWTEHTHRSGGSR